MDDFAILWFGLGWIAAAITPLLTEAARFGALVLKSEGKRRQMIAYAKLKVNGSFDNRQKQLKNILTGGDSNGKKD